MDNPTQPAGAADGIRDRWILSLDGGGMRGLTTAVFLGELENAIGAPLSGCFDLVAGTSSGAIVAGGLAIGPEGRQIAPTSELPDIFAKDGPRIFRSGSMGWWRTVNWLRGPLYRTERLTQAVEQRVGAVMLSDVQSDLLLTAYDMRLGQPVLFQSWLAGNSPACAANRAAGAGLMEMCPTQEGSPTPDFKLRDALVASSAVPTFFAPLKAVRADGEHYALIDGFVFALNPVLSAYFAARRRFGYANRFHILSIGTGRHQRGYDWDDLKDRGALGWLRPMLEAFPTGTSEASETYMDWITEIANVVHTRINPLFDHKNDPTAPSPEFDDATPENIQRLVAAGKKLFADNAERLAPTLAQLRTHGERVG
ncbi:MAG: patatin-like phospholipase family protein [Pseudomonadota bacterium]